jgi:hypothetical protein
MMKGFFGFVARLFGATALLLAFLSAVPVAQAIGAEITITAPGNGQTVSGKVTVAVKLGPDVYWDQLKVDGTSVWAGVGNCTWNSTTVANGTHTLKVRAFQKGGTVPVGTASISVVVKNSTASPTPVPPTSTPKATSTPSSTPKPTTSPTPAPSSTPTPSSAGAEISINAPSNGQTLSGTVPVAVTLGPDVYWNQLQVDGVSGWTGTGNCTWNSTTVANGTHVLTVRVFQQGGTTPIGTASVSVVVSNSSASPIPAPSSTPSPAPTSTASSTPTKSPTPTPAATPTPAPVPKHFSTLAYRATLPSDSQCTAWVNELQIAEHAPANTPFNVPPPGGVPSSFYSNPTPFQGDTQSVADFAGVKGDFTGSTDDIMRWAACRYGVDEDVVRAQGMTESHWDQGGAGDKRTTQSQCTQPGFTALWNTSIPEPDGSVVNCPNCCFQSWSLWQTKIYYETTTWPMIMQSTPFAADYRYATQRACMNGDNSTYFANQGSNTYASDIAAFKAGGPSDRVLWGCIGTPYSGGWYDSGAQSYITETQSHLAAHDWPGGMQ